MTSEGGASGLQKSVVNRDGKRMEVIKEQANETGNDSMANRKAMYKAQKAKSIFTNKKGKS